jgi:hypothetical protein
MVAAPPTAAADDAAANDDSKPSAVVPELELGPSLIHHIDFRVGKIVKYEGVVP